MVLGLCNGDNDEERREHILYTWNSCAHIHILNLDCPMLCSFFIDEASHLSYNVIQELGGLIYLKAGTIVYVFKKFHVHRICFQERKLHLHLLLLITPSCLSVEFKNYSSLIAFLCFSP
jgi:hypothetical protein